VSLTAYARAFNRSSAPPQQSLPHQAFDEMSRRRAVDACDLSEDCLTCAVMRGNTLQNRKLARGQTADLGKESAIGGLDRAVQQADWRAVETVCHMVPPVTM
jgi:hypothetical protein